MKALIGLTILAMILLVWFFRGAFRLGNAVYNDVVENGEGAHRRTASSLTTKASAALEVCTHTFAMQLGMGRSAPNAAMLKDVWVLGYIYGFCDGVLQKLKVGADECAIVISLAYIAVFQDQELGVAAVSVAGKLQDADHFQQGVSAGGQDAFSFLGKEVSPLALFEHLSRNEDVSPDSHLASRVGRIESTLDPRDPSSAQSSISARAEILARDPTLARWALIPAGAMALLLLMFGSLAGTGTGHNEAARAETVSPEVGPARVGVVREMSMKPPESVEPPHGQAIEFVEVPVPRPSFACSEASSHSEKLVCQSAALSELDIAMVELYQRTLSAVPAPDRLRAEQRDWLRAQRDSCIDNACIAAAYDERIAELREALEASQ